MSIIVVSIITTVINLEKMKHLDIIKVYIYHNFSTAIKLYSQKATSSSQYDTKQDNISVIDRN